AYKCHGANQTTASGRKLLEFPTKRESQLTRKKIRSEGYGLDRVTWSYPADKRPSWFADRSTVFHYSESSRPVAQQLALFMKSVTGQEFAVRRGAGLGVEPSRKDVTLFVHYIKK